MDLWVPAEPQNLSYTSITCWIRLVHIFPSYSIICHDPGPAIKVSKLCCECGLMFQIPLSISWRQLFLSYILFHAKVEVFLSYHIFPNCLAPISPNSARRLRILGAALGVL